MATAEIDRLEIEVDAASTQAVQHIKDLSYALTGMRKSAQNATTGLSGVVQQLKNVKTSGASASKAMNVVKNALAAIGYRQVIKYLGDAVTSINDYVENLNLFQVSMGKFYGEAYEYAQLVSNKLGVDPSQWMRTQGVFMSMANGFGMAEEQAYALSEGLTELSYDLSSLYNEDIETSATRLQSALAGEIEPIRRLGISISQATLEEYALAKGINESVAKMTEQEKALLRSLKLIEGAKDIGAIGDFAKTLESPANAIRVLNQQITQFKRAIGSVMLPAIIQILPYIQAFVSLLTDLISALAVLVGFEMPTWDSASWDSGFDSAAGSVDDTTDSVKKLKKETLGIDELNIISPDTGADALGGISGWAQDLEIPDLWDKNMLKEIETQAQKIREVLEKILSLAAAIGIAFLGWKIAQNLPVALRAIKDALQLMGGHLIATTPLAQKLATALKLAGVAAAIWIVIERFKDLYENNEAFRKGVGRVGQTADGVFTVVRDILKGVWTVITDIGTAVVGMFPDEWQSKILEFMDTLYLDWKDFGITALGVALMFIPGGQIAGGILLGFEAISLGLRALGGVSDEEWNAMVEDVSGWWETTKQSARDIYNSITGWFSEIGEFLSGVWEQLKESWRMTIEQFKEDAKTFFSFEYWKSIGQEMFNGLFDGLNEKHGRMQDFGNGLIADTEAALEIHSPSKKFEEIGVYCVEGMTNGFAGIYGITEMYAEQLSVMMSHSTTFFTEVNLMIDNTLDHFLNAMMEAQSTVLNRTNAMTTMFQNMSARSVSAVNAIISRLNAIPRSITTVHTIITKNVTVSAGSSGGSAKGYASGGYPEQGQLFLAREAGPELVGTLGGKTAVANNSQIEAGIEQAAYRGFSRAISEQQTSGTPIVVENKLYLDRKQLRFSLQQADRESGYAVSTGGVLTR